MWGASFECSIKGEVRTEFDSLWAVGEEVEDQGVSESWDRSDSFLTRMLGMIVLKVEL